MAHVCYQIFGGHQNINTDEKLFFSDTAPTCTDILDQDGDSNPNGVCDYKEHAETLKMGKKQRGYALGLKTRVAHYHRDNLQSPAKEETFAYDLNAYEALEGQGIYIGNSRMVSKTEKSYGRSSTKTFSDFDVDTESPVKWYTTLVSVKSPLE